MQCSSFYPLRSTISHSSYLPAMTNAHTRYLATVHCPRRHLILDSTSAAKQRPCTNLAASIAARPSSFSLAAGSRKPMVGLHPYLTYKLPPTVPMRGTSTTTHSSSQPLPTSAQSPTPVHLSPAIGRVSEEGQTTFDSANTTSIDAKIQQLLMANQQLQRSVDSLSKQLNNPLPIQRGDNGPQAVYTALLLMAFFCFINIVSGFAADRTYMFVPAAWNGTLYHTFVHDVFPSIVPLFSTAIVLLVCVQVVRVVWRALRR